MKTLMRLALWLYPAPWRRRYANELRRLIEDGHASPADLADLIAHAPLSATIRGEASTMYRHLSNHPTRVALIASAIVLPSAILVGASILKYILGVPGPFDAIEPSVTPFVTHPIGETLLVLAPYVAFGLALVPFTRLHVGWTDGRLAASGEAALPISSLVVGAVSAAMIVAMGVYWVAENL